MDEDKGPKRARGRPSSRKRSGRNDPGSAREVMRKATARASETTAKARDIAVRARDHSVARVRDLGFQARDRIQTVRTENAPLVPHLCFVQSPRRPIGPLVMGETVKVATYNVHRWQGVNGRAKPDVARAGYVISELDADVIALQEVLRPFATDADGATGTFGSFEDDGLPPGVDPLGQLCDELDLHLAFAVTRRHRRGQLGNAILSRYPITSISVIDISFSRIERRGALAAQIGFGETAFGVVATHLSLVDRTRHRQVQSLLDHPQLNAGAAVLMGDMNAWRNCKGSQVLEDEPRSPPQPRLAGELPFESPAPLPRSDLRPRNADVVERPGTRFARGAQGLGSSAGRGGPSELKGEADTPS